MAVTSSAIVLVDGDTKPTAPNINSKAIYIRNGTAYQEDSAAVETPLVNGAGSVSNVDGTLTISPTTGAVVASRAALTGPITVAGGSNATAIGASAADDATLEVSGGALREKDGGTSNAKLANMAANTVKANATAGSAAPADLAITANTFPARSSAGNIVAKPITDAGFAFAAAADVTAETALLNAATTALKGLQSATDKLKENNIWSDVTTDFASNNLDKTGATDNTTKLQAIVDSFSGGGVLYFPPGTYDISGVINIDQPLIFIGAGRSISVINMTAATGNMFLAQTGAAGMGFEQMRLSAESAGLRTTGFAFDMGAIANVYMQQCDILFQWSGVHSGGALQFLDDMNIREMGANAANGAAVLIDSTGDRYLRRLTTDNPSDPTGFAAVRVRECASCVLSDCNLINGTNALDIVPNAGAGHAVASILAMNTFFDSSSIGVNILPASNNDTAQRMRFVNCWFGSNSTANFRIGNGTIPNANIASVDIIGCDFFSAAGTPVPFGLDVLGATDWSVRASRFGGHTTNAIRVAVGTGTADHGFSITDNLVANCLGGGANAQGITIGAGTYKQYQILDNRGLDTNTTPGISDSGVVGPTGSKNSKNNMGALLGGIQQPLSSGGAALIAGRGAVTSGTGETFLMTYRVPANAVAVGQTFRLRMVLQSSSTGTLIATIRSGAAGTIAGDTVISITPASAAGVANQYFSVEGIVTVVALGPTATVAGAHQVFANAVYVSKTAAAEVVANVPTTAAWFITLSATASVGTYTVRHVELSAN